MGASRYRRYGVGIKARSDLGQWRHRYGVRLIDRFVAENYEG